jgi:hypothetical protein
MTTHIGIPAQKGWKPFVRCFSLFLTWVLPPAVCLPPAVAVAQDACAKERILLSSLQTQLSSAQAALNTPQCASSARTICQQKINLISQQIAGAEQYIREGCPPGKPLPPAPFDLVWQQTDDSGWPLNPIWYSQKQSGAVPDPNACLNVSDKFDNNSCSTQEPTEDLPNGWNGIWCDGFAGTSIPGHVNWMPVTYSGWTDWSDHSSNDDDYNFRFGATSAEADTPSNVVVAPTPQDPRGESTLLLEFDSDETIDHFDTPWWSSFHKAVDSGNVANLILSPQAIVTGLLGLDCEHGCGTEIHPVYSFAIEATPDPSNDVWAIFVRNWGDEGYCSSTDHQVQLTSWAIRLPWWPNATGVRVLNAPDNSDHLFKGNNSGVTGPDVTWTVGQGVLVRFTLPWPTEHGMMNGELHLQWIFTPTRPPITVHVPPSLLATLHPKTEIVENDTESRLNALYQRLTPTQKAAIDAATTSSPGTADEFIPHPTHPPQEVPSLATAPHSLAAVTAVPASAAAARDLRWKAAICAAYNNAVPGMAQFCN